MYCAIGRHTRLYLAMEVESGVTRGSAILIVSGL
jgi:hypothetical protein